MDRPECHCAANIYHCQTCFPPSHRKEVSGWDLRRICPSSSMADSQCSHTLRGELSHTSGHNTDASRGNLPATKAVSTITMSLMNARSTYCAVDSGSLVDMSSNEVIKSATSSRNDIRRCDWLLSHQAQNCISVRDSLVDGKGAPVDRS